MARQILPVVWTSGDIDTLKKNLKESATGTDLGVQACAALPDATRAAWGVFYADVLDYARTPTSFWTTASDANLGEKKQDELYAWQQKLAGLGCNAGAPAVNPQPPEAPGLGNLAAIFKWVALAAIVGAAAYATHEVVGVARDLLPSREPKRLAAGERRKRR